ncbi:MAG: hypothetical protein ACOYMI_02780 [Phycisphaerales bacterium]
MPSRPVRPPVADSWGGAPLDIARLRKLWKPRRDSYARAMLYEDVRIRIHRALTWLEFAARCDASEDLDARLVAQWIALNSLYGRWDDRAGSPMPDRESLRVFAEQILSHDHDGLVASVLRAHAKLAISLFEDRYLCRHFWEAPSTPSGRNRNRDVAWGAANAREHLREGRHGAVLDRVLDRIHFVRNQLVHGGSTFNGRLNRAAVRRASQMMDHLLACFLQVLMEHGYVDDWGGLCYPPIDER